MFRSEGDKGFYTRTPPETTMDKREYEVGESLKIRLSYDPRRSIETVQADVSCYDYFCGFKGNMALDRLEEGNAEAIVQPLPPCTAEISVELLYRVGIEDLLKKSVDVYGVLSQAIEL